MKSAPTLADAVIRETYRPHTEMQLVSSRPVSEIRAAIASAHKFILDDEMSAFVADLAHVPFLNPGGAKFAETLTVMRHGALLPHDRVWIEMSGREVKRRTSQIHSSSGKEIQDPWGNRYDPDDTAAVWGYLVERSRSSDIIAMTEFVGGGPSDPQAPALIPTRILWSPTDRPIFSQEEFAHWTVSRGDEVCNIGQSEAVAEVLSVLAHGIQGLYDPCVVSVPDSAAPAYGRMRMVEYVSERLGGRLEVPASVVECSGVARYIIALLSTINDIPVTREVVQPHKGYVARGSYKKFMEHTVVKLNVPQRVSRSQLAARLTAIIRKRAHEVRGHWRVYQRGEGALCAPSHHRWRAGSPDVDGKIHAPCDQCSAWRTWIEKHQRGDASLGFVTHSYAVTHGVDGRAA